MNSPVGSKDSSPTLSVERVTDTAALNAPPSQEVLQKPDEKDLHQVSVLNEILASKNDNDPRLDSELRTLSPAAKRLLEEKYHQLPAEKRNQRGTIAFLIGRDLKSADDVAFLTDILKEPPCLSMADCSKDAVVSGAPATTAGTEHLHEETGADASLHYPQLMVLAEIEARLDQQPLSSLPPGVSELIETATRSPVGRIASKARTLQNRF